MPWGLAFAGALAAQGPAPDASLRGQAIGEVRDAAGKPWLGAEVVLRSRPLPGDAEAGECDEVTAKVDERGRFHAAVLRGRPYSAWAWAAPDEHGRRASDVVELVFAQRAIVLQESRVLPRRRAVLEQTQRWPDAKFALRVVDQTGNRGVSWVDVCDGAAALPWLVGGDANVELFAIQGKLRVPLRRERLAADAGELRIEAPERHRTTCWVRNAGTPCADCEMLYVLGDALFAAGRTDQGGKLELDVPAFEPHSSVFRLFARCEGITVGLCSEIESNPRGPAPDLPSGAKPGDWFTNADSGSAASLHILGGDGLPLGGVEVWAAGMATQRPDRSSRGYDRWFGTLTTDANGDARVLGLTKQPPMVHLLLPDRALATLPPAWRSGLAPVVFAPLVGATGTGTREAPYVVDPRRMCPLELRLTLPNGDPAALAEIALAVLHPRVDSPWAWNRDALHADQVGCVRILVPGDVHLGIRAVLGESMLIRGLATVGGHVDAGPAVVTLRLPPPTAVHGRLVDQTGAPIAGRLISPDFDTDKPMEWRWHTEPSAAPDTQNRAHVLLPDDEHERLMLTSLIERSVPTDADGRFVVPLPADPLAGLLLFESAPDARPEFDPLQVRWTGETQDDVVFTAMR